MCRSGGKATHEERPHSSVRNKIPIGLVNRSMAIGRLDQKTLEKYRKGSPRIGGGSSERADCNCCWIKVGDSIKMFKLVDVVRNIIQTCAVDSSNVLVARSATAKPARVQPLDYELWPSCRMSQHSSRVYWFAAVYPEIHRRTRDSTAGFRR